MAGRIVEWIGDRTLIHESQNEVGQSLVIQANLRRFVNPVRRYIDGTPTRYRRFRRLRQNENRWYQSNGFNVGDIHPLEIDVLLLAVLRAGNEIVTKTSTLADTNSPSHMVIMRQRELYRTQVLIDEATDFSPIQLGCMAAITRPGINSFFACGDFNQRVTQWGIRSVEEFKWVFPDIEFKKIEVTYRHSTQLHEFAKQLILSFGGELVDVALPDFVDNDGVPPVLAKNMSEESKIIDWLATRIIEIENFVEQLPSIAILVNGEAKVLPISTALNDALETHNIRVIACPNGQVMGHESDVRVFDVQHVKGLEFEAVFFVGADLLAETYPDLFDKYLYVGATRAAMYLGIICEQELPFNLKKLEALFDEDWQ